MEWLLGQHGPVFLLWTGLLLVIGIDFPDISSVRVVPNPRGGCCVWVEVQVEMPAGPPLGRGLVDARVEVRGRAEIEPTHGRPGNSSFGLPV